MNARPHNDKKSLRTKGSLDNPVAPFLSQLDFPLFHKIIDNIGDELMLIDKEGRIIFVNSTTVKGLGLPREELLGRKVTDFFKKKISPRRWRQTHYKELKNSQQPLSYQIERVNHKGETETINITAVYTTFNGQECVLSIARNITRMVMLEKELQEAVSFYSLISDGAGDPIFILDVNGYVTYANNMTEKILNTPVEDLVGRHYKDFIQLDSLKTVKAVFQKSIKSPGQFRVEGKVVAARGGVIPVDVAISRIVHNKKVVAVHVIARDLRPRQELEQLVIESEKMKAIQYFLAGTAMELRNPLFGVLKKCEMITSKYRDKDFEYVGFREFSELRSTLDSIHQQIKYCVETTERLNNLSRKKIHMRTTGCHPNEVIRDLLNLKGYQMRMTDIHFELRLMKDVPLINVGVIDFHQIMTNVINNAVESMTAGGTLVVRSVFQPETKMVLIEVKDDGVGISKDVLGRIYEPFFTTKQQGSNKNSGLGLTIVYALIKSCHGTINVSSDLRKGTTVQLFFPTRKSSALRHPARRK
ncbi:MAG: PAS domain S-box protein [Candidatus Omnitrophota bacterium]|jgi:PAS domain S-box-containing protein